MALTSADLARLGPGAQRQILAKLAKPPEKRQKYGNRKAMYEKYGIEVTEI